MHLPEGNTDTMILSHSIIRVNLSTLQEVSHETLYKRLPSAANLPQVVPIVQIDFIRLFILIHPQITS